MRTQISDEQIEIEANPGYRPPAVDTGITILPLSALGDREFELLAFLLLKAEIAAGRHPKFSAIALMQGVSERGRDCVLYKDGIVAGLVQCKKYAGRLTRPQVLKEIVKFALFAVQDSSIIPNRDAFEYKIFVSNDLTEPAIALVHSYETEVEAEITAGNLTKYATEIVEEYESFAPFRGAPPIEEVLAIVRSIRPTCSNASDLSTRIYGNEEILKSFFNVRTVVSIEDADRIVRNALEDYGLKFLTDQDLKIIQQRITSTNTSHRINLGLVDFFGFDVEFFRHIKGEDLKDILAQVVRLKSSLDMKMMEFIQSKINTYVLRYITGPLLATGKIHTFSVNIAAPYLVKRLIPFVVGANLPQELTHKFYPGLFVSKTELLDAIAEQLFASSERILHKDYSELVGDQETIQFKIKLYEHIHSGFTSIDQIRARFAIDVEVLKPVLDQIEGEITALLSPNRTVLIKDGSFFGDKNELSMVVNSLKAIDTQQT